LQGHVRKNLETVASKGAKRGTKAEMFYILNNHAYNILVAMRIGLMDNDGALLFDNEIPPWNNSL
jgi:hypothetical protein